MKTSACATHHREMKPLKAATQAQSSNPFDSILSDLDCGNGNTNPNFNAWIKAKTASGSAKPQMSSGTPLPADDAETEELPRMVVVQSQLSLEQAPTIPTGALPEEKIGAEVGEDSSNPVDSREQDVNRAAIASVSMQTSNVALSIGDSIQIVSPEKSAPTRGEPRVCAAKQDTPPHSVNRFGFSTPSDTPAPLGSDAEAPSSEPAGLQNIPRELPLEMKFERKSDSSVKQESSSSPARPIRQDKVGVAERPVVFQLNRGDAELSSDSKHQSAHNSEHQSSSPEHQNAMPSALNFQNISAPEFSAQSSPLHETSEATVIQHIAEALPKPIQPGSVTLHSPEFGTIRIVISHRVGATDGGEPPRIHIQVASPAARALLDKNIDYLRQNLQTDFVQVSELRTTLDSASNPRQAGDRQDRRRTQYFQVQRQVKNRSENESAFWE